MKTVIAVLILTGVWLLGGVRHCAAAKALDPWRLCEALPQGNYLGVAFGSGVFVADVDTVGLVTSTDGRSWVHSSVFSRSTMGEPKCLSFANGSFYDSAGFGSVLQSLDGLAWVRVDGLVDSSSGGIRDLQSGGGAHVAVLSPDFLGNNLSVSASPTLSYYWAQRSVAGPQALNGVSYGNGTFVVVGDGGRIATSPDGTNWTTRFAEAAIDLRLNSVAFGAGRFVAVGELGVIVTSPDGVTWTSPLPGNAAELKKVHYGNGLFVAVGVDGAIATSADGETWFSRVSGTLQTLRGVSYGNGTFLAVGDDTTVLSSPDGVNWSPLGRLTTQRLTSVIHGGNQFVAVGFGGTVLTSPDGVRWRDRDSGTGVGLYSVAYGNGIYAAVGEIILSSPDGITWSLRDSGPNYDFETVSFINGHFMAVGAGGAIKVSTNGINWFTRSSGALTILYGVTYGNGLYVITGGGGVIRTSPDGVVWTPRTSGTVQDLNGVTFANGQFVTQGNSGVILTSSNGVTWTARNSGTGQGLVTSAYSFGQWVAVGLDGTILASTNSIDWISHRFRSGTTALLIGVAAGPSTFVAVGDNGVILQSAGLEPVIEQEAAYVEALAGAVVQLEAHASGVPPLSYQWIVDGVAIAGATNVALTLSNLPVRIPPPLYYGLSVVAINDYGATARLLYELNVRPFLITVSGINSWPDSGPDSLEVRRGSDVNFAVSVESLAPVTYRWLYFGLVDWIEFPGQTGHILNLTNVQVLCPDCGGDYDHIAVIISNRFGAEEFHFFLTVLDDVAITQPPLNLAVPAGGTATFSVAISGNPPLYEYEWSRLEPSPAFTNTFFDWQRSGFFTLTNVQNSVTGSYRVIIRNGADLEGASATFNLTLLSDSDGDGLPDIWETAYPTAGDGEQDADLDGISNRREYIAGTDPTNAQSYLKVDRISGTGSTVIEFMAIANKTYSVQYCDSLDGASWSKLADVVARTSDRVETVTDPTGGTNRYYRLVTPRQE